MSDTEPQWMSGAVPVSGLKDNPLAFTTPLRERKEVKEYFEQIGSEPPGHTCPSLGVHAPHSCPQCDSIVIESKVLADSALVMIVDSLETAVEHARAGCLFFRWLVSLLVHKEGSTGQRGLFDGDTCAEIRFFLRFNPTWKHGMPMNFGIWIERINVGEEFTLDVPRTGHLHVCAAEDDIAASYILSRPYEPNNTSHKTISFVRESLEDCLNNHPKCRCRQALSTEVASLTERVSPEDLPTRLLRIESNGSRIKLIIINELDDDSKYEISQRGYASLSYCWGGPQPLCLTSHTMQALCRGIETSTLPRTLQDAVASSIVSLGLDHIWIDALCIKQDDDVDKQLEIARMPLYYGRNTVTISAASAATCTEGFLLSTPSDKQAAFQAGPFNISFSTPKGIGKIQLSQAAETAAEPIASRGWTYQESLLSRRLVIYGSRQVYWTCNTASGSYGGADAKADSAYDTPDTLLLGTSQNLARILQYPWRDAWVEVVREFMTRALGVESDKLVAVAALAARMADEAAERGMRVRYLAGLFVSSSDSNAAGPGYQGTAIIQWAEQLLWYVDSSSSKRPVAYRAPSWSWASVDASKWSSLRTLMPLPWDVKKYEFDFKVTESTVEHTHPATAAYGSIESASLTVQGWVKRLNGSSNSLAEEGSMITCSFPPFNAYILAKSERTRADLLLYGDTADDADLIRSASEGRAATDEVYLLELIPIFLPRRSPSLGLVLKGHPDESMSRIGVYVFYCDELEVLESFFDGIVEDCRLV